MSKKIDFAKVKSFYSDVPAKENAVLERKAETTATLRAGENGVIEAVFSTPSTDRDGDILYPGGCVSDFYNGVVVWNHDLSGLPIGRCDDFSIGADGIVGRIKLSDVYPFARDVYNLVREGILRGISIGFIPLEEVIRGTRAFAEFVARTGIAITDETQRIISRWEWIETSLCLVGCNRDALIYGVAAKAISLADDRTKTEFGLDRVETKSIIDLTAKIMNQEQAITSLTKAVESIATKAATTLQAKAVTAAETNPALLSWRAYERVLRGEESDLAKALSGVWGEAATAISALNPASPEEAGSALDGIVSEAAKRADALTRSEIEKIADGVFAGYRTGYDGITPIKDIAKINEWKNEFVADYINALQPDPNKPLADATLSAYRDDYLRAVQAGEQPPVLDMTASLEATANQAVYGAQQQILTALMAEAGSGDLVQVRGVEDERLCDACAPYLDQFLSTSGASEKFESVADAKQNGWGHPNCRCILVPVAAPTVTESKSVAATAPTLRLIRKGVVAPTRLTDADKRSRAEALARGRLV